MAVKSSVKDKSENILVALQAEQAKNGCLSPDFMTKLAASLGVPINYVYGVATFYSFLSVKPLGRNVIRVCRSLPCYLKGGQLIAEAVADEIGIGPGQTTPDGRFSFELANCIGLCDRAPAMLVNGDAHVDLTPAKIKQILKDYK